MTPGDVERTYEEIKRHLGSAQRHQRAEAWKQMHGEAETAAMLFRRVRAEADDPMGMLDGIRKAMRSFGYSEEECDVLLSSPHSPTSMKKSKGKKAKKNGKKDDKSGTAKPLPAKPQLGYHPAPKTLPGFPNAQPAPRKTPVQGGGGLRKRWKDYKKKRIYEWDSQHGEVEEWSWDGKRHLGSSDPTGKPLKGPDPKKKAITPTITKPMDTKTTFGLYWFSAESEELIGEADLPDVNADDIRKWFFLPADEPLTDAYIVRASQRHHLVKLVKDIDLNKYDYFLECFRAD